MADRCDVAVVGAGVAGRLAWRWLQAAGVDAVLVDQQMQDPLVPLLQVGTAEPPHRLEAALGTERARAYVQLTRQSGGLLREELEVTAGGWRVGIRDEAKELQDAVAASSRLGLESRLTDTPLGRARLVPEDGTVDLSPLTADIRSSTVTAIDEGDRLHLHGADLQCEVVLLCGDWRLAQLAGWFADKLTPVRAQALLLDGAVEAGGSGQWGHLYWANSPDGLLVGGARWATPHMESGETDPSPNPRVSERLRAFAAQHWPDATERGERAHIRTYTCDNLPIVGPMPGRSRVVCCAGFGENELALAPVAARVVVDGVLTGRSDWPGFLAASRFV
jgi:glycine/D-amino acid oxidase-like deaminating enzyme